jgi:camphor 5-monooxygenase
MDQAAVLDDVAARSALAPRPDHVPADRVIDFDVYARPPAGICPQQMWFDMQDRAKHPVMWTPHNGGHWIALTPDLTEAVLSEWDPFSTKCIMVPREPMGETYSKYLPLSLDPPDHIEFRRILNENLGAKSIARMKADVEELTIALIERFQPNGRCNFTHDFAEQLPVRIFMRVVDLPEEDLPRLKYLSDQFTRPDGSITHPEVEQQFSDYIGPIIRSRRGKYGNDLITEMVNGRVFDRPITDEEAENMCIQVLIAGLDTVVNLLGFIFSYLATHPELRRTLASDPSLHEDAINEFLRRFPLVANAREVRREVEFGGVTLKPRDMIMGSTILVAMSEKTNADPLEFQLKRAKRHFYLFGKGIHVCPGAPLARLELKVILKEWLARIPEFRLVEGANLSYMSGIVSAVSPFELEWEV